MKKVLLFALMVAIVLTATSVFATEKYVLGNSNVALKVDYINFTEDVFDEIDLESGLYVGLEGYYGIMPNLYLGLEAGWAGTSNDDFVEELDSDVDIDVTLVPIELNLKYAFEVSPALVIDIGAGVSYSWFNVEVDVDELGDADEDDWVFGGQVFADVNYKFSKMWFVGINGKYQFTEDLEFDVQGEDVETDSSADNWRVGAHVGMMF
jgi:opacity protein-like surface antigen